MAYDYRQIRRVEFVDTDLAGVMHFSNYFRFMEAAEHAFYRSLGLRIHPRPGDHEIGWPRVAATCAFTAPLRFDDKVEIQLIVRAKKEKSITYDFIFRKLEDGESAEVAEKPLAAARCPAVGRTERPSGQPEPLNEVSQFTELAAIRMLLTKEGDPSEQ